MVKTAVDTYGGLDMALNNAGVMDGVFSGDPIDFQKQMTTDIRLDTRGDRRVLGQGVPHQCGGGVPQHALGTRADGRTEARRVPIVNVGSIAGMTGLAGNPAYVASKHAVTGLTRNAAVDYAPYGIRVNSVNMAATDTPMVEEAQTCGRNDEGRYRPWHGTRKDQSLLAYAELTAPVGNRG